MATDPGAGSNDTRAAMFQLGRALRYRPLPIIGQRVHVASLAEVTPALEKLTRPWLRADAAWDGCDIEGGLAKYGLLDRWCPVETDHLDHPATLRGVPALRVNGFGRRDPDPDPDIEEDMRFLEAGCLVDLATELDTTVLKLFLYDDIPEDQRHTAPLTLASMTRLRPGYFPRTFTVDDACITNAGTIWFTKHFYL